MLKNLNFTELSPAQPHIVKYLVLIRKREKKRLTSNLNLKPFNGSENYIIIFQTKGNILLKIMGLPGLIFIVCGDYRFATTLSL